MGGRGLCGGLPAIPKTDGGNSMLTDDAKKINEARKALDERRKAARKSKKPKKETEKE